MEQLHTHDCYQNVTRHKPGQAAVATLNKIYRHAQHRKWVRLATPAGMPCPVGMVAACKQV